MPKRNRKSEQRKQYGLSPIAPPRAVNAADSAASPMAPLAKPIDDEATRAAKMFADSVRAHEVADQAEQDRARAETEQMLHHESLRDAKQRAADQIKRLRGQPGSRQRMVEAEATYRAALAELQEFETGERPHWAPAVAAPEVIDVVEPTEPADGEIEVESVSTE